MYKLQFIYPMISVDHLPFLLLDSESCEKRLPNQGNYVFCDQTSETIGHILVLPRICPQDTPSTLCIPDLMKFGWLPWPSWPKQKKKLPRIPAGAVVNSKCHQPEY
uniref:Uncharacterized protein n=1 Tax=Oryza brachyantha TaxID=4533 RepID=J3L3S3_ORYBR